MAGTLDCSVSVSKEQDKSNSVNRLMVKDASDFYIIEQATPEFY